MLGLLKESDEIFNLILDHKVKASEKAYECFIGTFQKDQQYARIVR